MRISSLYRQQQLAIGILDMGSTEELKATLNWYMSNMNCCLHVITMQSRIDEDPINEDYPDVTFLCFKNMPSIGEMINAFADECYATFFMVTRTDCQIIAFDGAALVASMNDRNHPAVSTPLILNQEGELLPTLRAPYIRGKEIDPLSFLPNITEAKTKEKTLYPLLGLGFYDRALFQRLRGYDEEIMGEFYQVLDFGIRCYLFGHTIFSTSDFVLQFPQKHSIIEDRSACIGMNRCYTKALSIHRIAGKNVVEKWKPYVDKQLLKTEIKKKQIILQKTDFFTLIEQWKNEDE